MPAGDAGTTRADGGGAITGDAGSVDAKGDGGAGGGPADDGGATTASDDAGVARDGGMPVPDGGAANAAEDGGPAGDGGGDAAADGGAANGGDGGALPGFCTRREPARGQDGWEIVCGDMTAGHLLGVWGSSENDVYFVGGVAATTTILHWDGASLVRMANPGRAQAWWVFGTDADHVYVVGERGLGLRRLFGGAWERFETGTTQTIFGLWGPSPDDLFYVTGDIESATPTPHVYRLRSADVAGPDGGTIPGGTPVAQTLPPTPTRSYFKVWGSSASNLLVVGERGTILRFDGASWDAMSTPNASSLLTISGSPGGDVYAVGGATEGVLWKLDADGRTFRDVALPAGTPALMGVVSQGRGRALVSGVGGFAARVDADHLMPDGRMSTDDLHALFATSQSVWAVGGNLFSSESSHGIIQRRPRADPPCPPGGIATPGFHHLDLQGRLGTPNADGTYPMFDATPRGHIDPRLVHGEHYLLGRGAFAQWTAPLCADLTDKVTFRIPNNDEAGAVATHQLFVVRGGVETLVAQSTDDAAGQSGYNPFDRSNAPPDVLLQIAEVDTSSDRSGEHEWSEIVNAPSFETPPVDVLARAGDTLLLRSTNLTDYMFSVMVWYPQTSLGYQSFIEVEVPAAPGGAPLSAALPPPEPGPCATPTADRFIELGKGDESFVALGTPASAPVVVGPQGSLMFTLSARGRGFDAGDPAAPLSARNPWLFVTLTLDAPAPAGRFVADLRGRQGFTLIGADRVLTGVRPTVPAGTFGQDQLAGETIYARVILVDRTGQTLCEDTTFEATLP